VRKGNTTTESDELGKSPLLAPTKKEEQRTERGKKSLKIDRIRPRQKGKHSFSVLWKRSSGGRPIPKTRPKKRGKDGQGRKRVSSETRNTDDRVRGNALPAVKRSGETKKTLKNKSLGGEPPSLERTC